MSPSNTELNGFSLLKNFMVLTALPRQTGDENDFRIAQQSLPSPSLQVHWQLTVTVNLCTGQSPSPTTVESVCNSEPGTIVKKRRKPHQLY